MVVSSAYGPTSSDPFANRKLGLDLHLRLIPVELHVDRDSRGTPLHLHQLHVRWSACDEPAQRLHILHDTTSFHQLAAREFPPVIAIFLSQ